MDELAKLAKVDCNKCILQGTIMCEVCKPVHDSANGGEDGDGDDQS